MPGGSGVAAAAGTTTNCAYPPPPQTATTGVPTAGARTPSPSAATVPATSMPRVKGSGVGSG